MDNIIYIVILAHGIHEYNRQKYDGETDDTMIYAKQKRPSPFKTRLYKSPNVIIPDNITYIQKITYTPFGLYNIMSSNDSNKIYNELLQLLSRDFIIGEPLTKIITDDIVFESIESKLSKPENPEHILEDLRLLMENKDDLCQEYIYDKTGTNNIPLKNKSFSMESYEEENEDSEIEEKRGIYVMQQQGGPLSIGNNILERLGSITTQELLEKLSEYGYNKIVIIDYSCEICTTTFGMKPEDSHINSVREEIKLGKIGRGGKRKLTVSNKKSKIHNKTKKHRNYRAT